MNKYLKAFKIAATAFAGALTLVSAAGTKSATPSTHAAKTPVVRTHNSIFSQFGNAGLSADWQYVFAGDSDHETSAAQEFLATPGMMKMFAQDGGKHIFLELPSVIQPNIDALYEGKITPEQFAETGLQVANADGKTAEVYALTFGNPETDKKKMQLLSQVIIDAKNNGVKIWSADEAVTRPDTPELQRAMAIVQQYTAVQKTFTDEFVARNKDAIERATKDGTLSLLKTKMDAEFMARYPELNRDIGPADKLIVDSRNDDRDLARFVTSRAGNDRAMIVYGAHHLISTQANSLGSLLGANNVKFNIFEDEQSAEKGIPELCRMDNVKVPVISYRAKTQQFQKYDLSSIGCPTP